MNLEELFSKFQSDDGLKNEFTGALSAGQEILEKFLKDHDIAAAVSDVIAYIKENASDLLGFVSPDILSSVGEAVSGIASDVVSGAEEAVDQAADAVEDVAETGTQAASGFAGILAKIKELIFGK
ncbi:MAG: hypothetical protein IKE43_04385 [Coriobacteriales bacterium]|nr:hypothetical protein [Coriobacteriales bacterium]